MRIGKIFLIIVLFTLALPALADRTWEQVLPPGAICGDGQPYEVYISRKDPKKIAFTFQGGGACWSGETCWGPFKTIFGLSPKKSPPATAGTRSEDPELSPIPDYTIVYFPYCTGDVHLGRTKIKYWGKKRPVHHVGRTNVERAMAHIAATANLDLTGADKVVIYGESAGAIGALYHIRTIAPYLRQGPGQEKTLIADSPGLHFGPLFWIKFPSKIRKDYADALGKAGIGVRLFKGNLARFVPNLCERFPQWRFGVLQGSYDLMMAGMGATTPLHEHWMIYGRKGLHKLTLDPNDNCAAWIADVTQHTFLTTEKGIRRRWGRPLTAREFALDVIEGKSMRSYP